MNKFLMGIFAISTVLIFNQLVWAGPMPGPEVPPGTETPQAEDQTGGSTGVHLPRVLNQSGGGMQPQAGSLPREVQPGEETPQTDDDTSDRGLRPPRGAISQPGGGDGTQTEDELYVGRKAGGGQVSSGDEDDIEDLEIERRTIQGESRPGLESPQVGAQTGGLRPPRGNRAAEGYSPGGGDGTQTEDELYVGKKAGETPLDSLGQTPAATPPGMGGKLSKPANKLSAQPVITPAAKGPGAIVIPRANCGDYHTGWVDVPNADVNPCPKSCLRGEQLSVDQHPGDSPLYSAWYHCYLPEIFVNQSPDIKPLEEGTPPRKNCGTHWAGGVDDPNAEVNPCPKNCERGELRSVSRNIFNGVLRYEMNYQCYVAEPHARILTIPTLTLTGSGPTSRVAVDSMALIGNGPTANVMVPVMTLAGAGPTASVSVPGMSLIGLRPLNMKVDRP